MRLLIAEDDQALGSFLLRGLRGEGVEVELATDGETALLRFLEAEPDLLILDLDLPVRSGLEVLSSVRELSPLCPVLVLSGRPPAETYVRCLDLGADHCMAKPFSLQELRARCRAMLRRQKLSHERLEALAGSGHAPSGPAQLVLTLGELTLHRLEHQALVGSQVVPLTNREYSLLEQLLLAEGATVSRHSLRALVGAKQGEANAIDVHVAALRRKLALSPGAPVILSVRGQGYRLTPALANENTVCGIELASMPLNSMHA